jgi:hypothetical protein
MSVQLLVVRAQLLVHALRQAAAHGRAQRMRERERSGERLRKDADGGARE